MYLAVAVNPFSSGLAILTLLTYLFVYTPLKRETPLCVLVGAFPGAMPPLIGWAGGSGRLSIEAGILYAIVFLWQFPHFMAIAWMYREDYERAGYLVLPKGNARIPFVTLETLLPLLALVAISMVQCPTRHAAILYCGSAMLGLGFLYFGLEFVLQRSRSAARRLLAASIVYPLLFVLNATLCNRGRKSYLRAQYSWCSARNVRTHLQQRGTQIENDDAGRRDQGSFWVRSAQSDTHRTSIHPGEGATHFSSSIAGL